MTSLTQKSLLGLTILATVGLVALLASKRFGLESRKRDGLLLEMISNVSSDLDRLDAGFDGISTQVDVARNRLGELVVLHRENLVVCAILRERRNRSILRKARQQHAEQKSREGSR